GEPVPEGERLTDRFDLPASPIGRRCLDGVHLGASIAGSPLEREKADDGDRTRDPQLGKLMLYQLSYVRVALDSSRVRNCDFRAGEGAGTLGGCAARLSFSPCSSPAALPPAASGARSRSPRPTAAAATRWPVSTTRSACA